MNVFLVLLCLLCCGYGLILIFAKDVAWNYVSWRNRNEGVASARNAQWDTNATFQGIIIVVAGLCMLFLLPHVQPPASVSQPGQTTYGIDGRKATAQEKQELQHEMDSGAFRGTQGQPASQGH